jgi:hypothetical protein
VGFKLGDGIVESTGIADRSGIRNKGGSLAELDG